MLCCNTWCQLKRLLSSNAHILSNPEDLLSNLSIVTFKDSLENQKILRMPGNGGQASKNLYTVEDFLAVEDMT